MRGLFFQNTGSLDNLQVAELPRPVPKAGEVLVQVHAAAINPSDVKNVLGRMAETKTPRVPGRDFAGRVVSGDSRWEGKSVFGTGGDIGFGRDGSHAEFVAVPVEGLVELPPDLSYENAAAIALGYFTAFAGIVRTGAVKRGETVLVTGTTGSVGSAAARVAAWKGARVLGTVRSSRDLGKRGDLPLVEWIDLESRPLPESVKELTEGKGKTKIIYCKDVDRIGDYPKEKFDFLGFEFRPRGAKSRLGSYFVGFLPAVSKKAAKSIRSVIRGWRLHRFSDKSLLDLSRMFNPIIRGWINYYGSFYRSALYPLFDQLNRSLKKWAMRKYKRLRGRQRRAAYWLRRIRSQQPSLFSHWQLASHQVADR